VASLIDDDGADQDNVPEYSVSELSGAVKRTVEGAFGFVRVRGEVGRVSRPRSGHVYLDLKDDRAVLAGVIWKGVAAGLSTQPEEGMEVVATGRLTTFPGQSKYQIVIEQIAPAGVGALMAMLEKRRKALAAEGLFDETRKRMLPFLPGVVGVVTSPSGAVIRDILHRFADRFPVRVLVWPVAVQGERCAPEVAAAIRGFNALAPDGAVPRPDVLIVARGGGSVEDLWGFNEEIVVRAAADSEIPLVSAVGHETDTTLIDFAADRRAPTPSAAAEMCVPVRGDLLALLADLQARRLRALRIVAERRRQRLVDLARALPRPAQILAERRQRLDLAAMRLPSPRDLTRERRHALDQAAGRLPQALRQRTHDARLTLTRRAAGLSARPIRQSMAYFSGRLGQASDRLAPALARLAGHGRDRLRALARTLSSLGYRNTLARGYAVVRDGDGNVLPRARGIAVGTALAIQFADSTVAATASAAEDEPEAPKPARPRKPRSRTKDDGQGSLF